MACKIVHLLWKSLSFPSKLPCQLASSSMSWRNGAYLPAKHLAEPRQTLLPFLYHTRTLLCGSIAESLCLAQQKHRKDRRTFSSSIATRFPYNPSQQVSDVQRYDRIERRSKFIRWAPASQDQIVEEQKIGWSSSTQKSSRDPEVPQDSARWSPKPYDVAPVQQEKPRNSTITASEKAAFDRIFSEISKNAATKDEERDGKEIGREAAELEQSYLEVDSVGEEDVPGDPRDQLAAIFELAIAETKEGDLRSLQGSHEEDSRFKDDSYTRAIKLSSDSLGRATFAQEGPFKRVDLEQALPGNDEESEATLKRASDDHRQFVDSLLEAANTDMEIWAVLEKEVFSLMTQLNFQIKLEEKARKANLRRQKKAAKAAVDSNKATEVSENATSATTKKPLLTLSPATESKALTTNALLSILQSNYAHYCLHALRLFRSRRLSSPYALHLLLHLKSLGPISYVLGASSALYNEILYQKWTQFSDVRGIADLMEEMVNQGISANITTLEFLRFVDRSRRLDLLERNRGAKRTWWYMRPIKEGWVRVRGLYQRFMSEMGDLGRRDMESMRAVRWHNGLLRKVEHERERIRRVETAVLVRRCLDVPLEQESEGEREWEAPTARAGPRELVRSYENVPFDQQERRGEKDWEAPTPRTRPRELVRRYENVPNDQQERRGERDWEVPKSRARPRDGLGIAPRPDATAEGTTLRDWE